MSTMTKYLKQSCTVAAYKLDDAGKPELNMFGEIQYQPPQQCRCRHEIAFQDIQVSNGSIVRSTARYFLDDTMEIRADYLIDGRAALSVASYVDALGSVIGYEVYV